MTSFKQFQLAKVNQIDHALDQRIPASSIEPQLLHQAMRYSSLNGGKRIRAMLVYATGYLLDTPTPLLDDIACSIELIHAYSLIHDDLPAMDNDDLRRGKPSCHKAFDEATAILAGDALLTLAFNVLANADCSDELKVDLIKELSTAAGSNGMVGGQAFDLASEGTNASLADVENMHIHKTGKLICACITLVASSRFSTVDKQYLALKGYAESIGLAFQVQDDILDETASTEALGKTQGKDKQAEKSTYPALLGLKSSQQLVKDLYTNALQNLTKFDQRADYLRDIAHLTISRTN